MEDVSWALSTAEAMWGRGDRADALKWVRRAAEAASEAEADDRALEIAKAAADLAQSIERSASMPPPASPGPTAKPPALPSTPPQRVSHPPTPPRVSSPRLTRSGSGPIAPTPLLSKPSAPPAAQASRGSHSEIGRRPRKSSHPPEEAPAKSERKSQPVPKRPSSPSEPRRRKSTNPPAGGRDEREESSDTTTLTPPKPPSAPPPSGRGTELSAPPATEVTEATEEMEGWPTQALAGNALAELGDEMTRVNSPAFVDDDRPTSHGYSIDQGIADPAPTPRPPRSGRPPASAEPALRASQAMHVVVWRAADGVHVAPHGTTVSAITIDALLVALDPSADLASWLAKK